MDDATSRRQTVITFLLDASDENIAATDVSSATSLREDLDLSSMQAITLVMDLEDAFGITVEDEEIAELATVGEILALVERKCALAEPTSPLERA